jgi:hypothetical protein
MTQQSEQAVADELGFEHTPDPARGGNWGKFSRGDWTVWIHRYGWQAARLEDNQQRDHLSLSGVYPPGYFVSIREAMEYVLNKEKVAEQYFLDNYEKVQDSNYTYGNTPPPGKSYWRDEDDTYPHEDWVYEVVGGNTRLGYWDWVRDEKEGDGEC